MIGILLIGFLSLNTITELGAGPNSSERELSQRARSPRIEGIRGAARQRRAVPLQRAPGGSRDADRDPRPLRNRAQGAGANITEAGELEATRRCARCGTIRGAVPAPGGAGRPGAGAGGVLLPTSTGVRRAERRRRRDPDLNQDAMVLKSDHARAAAERLSRVTIAASPWRWCWAAHLRLADLPGPAAAVVAEPGGAADRRGDLEIRVRATGTTKSRSWPAS